MQVTASHQTTGPLYYFNESDDFTDILFCPKIILKKLHSFNNFNTFLIKNQNFTFTSFYNFF